MDSHRNSIRGKNGNGGARQLVHCILHVFVLRMCEIQQGHHRQHEEKHYQAQDPLTPDNALAMLHLLQLFLKFCQLIIDMRLIHAAFHEIFATVAEVVALRRALAWIARAVTMTAAKQIARCLRSIEIFQAVAHAFSFLSCCLFCRRQFNEHKPSQD